MISRMSPAPEGNFTVSQNEPFELTGFIANFSTALID